jgi:hypothetical protein
LSLELPDWNTEAPGGLVTVPTTDPTEPGAATLPREPPD